MGKGEQKKINKKTLEWVIPVIVLLTYMIIELGLYTNTMEKSAAEKALDRINRQAISVAGYYNGYLEALVNTAEAFANDFTETEDLYSEDNIRLLNNISESLDLSNAMIIKSDLTAVDKNGVAYKKSEIPKELRDFSQIKSHRDFLVDEEGNVEVYITAPIRTEKEWWGNVIFEFRANRMQDLIDSKVYSFALMSSTGMIAECAGETNTICSEGDNIKEVLKGITFVESSANMFTQNIEARRSGKMVVMDKNGTKQYVSYQPVGKWGACVLVTVREDQIKRSVRDENRETRLLILKILLSIAIFIAIIIATSVINRVGYLKESKELQNKAETDLLTELLNKVSTEKKIQEYLDGEGKDKINMMCVLDVDNFKKINDTMGHAFGDEVLASLGKGIRSEFRVSDIIGRIGGDEFVIFLKDLKSDEIIEREAKRIELFFKNFQVGSYTRYSPTASIGAALYPRDASDYASMYKAADTALYKAKKRGKNQLAFYKDATPEDMKEVEEMKNKENEKND